MSNITLSRQGCTGCGVIGIDLLAYIRMEIVGFDMLTIRSLNSHLV